MTSERDREMANDVLNRSGEEQADLDLVEIIAAALAQARAEERGKWLSIVEQLQQAADLGRMCCEGESFDEDAKFCRDAIAAAIRARANE